MSQMDGLVWQSLVYEPDNDMDGLAGPDTNTRCESPSQRHSFGQPKPPARWVELLWYPKGDKTVARCWKTCEDCHVALANGAERVSA